MQLQRDAAWRQSAWSGVGVSRRGGDAAWGAMPPGGRATLGSSPGGVGALGWPRKIVRRAGLSVILRPNPPGCHLRRRAAPPVILRTRPRLRVWGWRARGRVGLGVARLSDGSARRHRSGPWRVATPGPAVRPGAGRRGRSCAGGRGAPGMRRPCAARPGGRRRSRPGGWRCRQTCSGDHRRRGGRCSRPGWGW